MKYPHLQLQHDPSGIRVVLACFDSATAAAFRTDIARHYGVTATQRRRRLTARGRHARNLLALVGAPDLAEKVDEILAADGIIKAQLVEELTERVEQ